MHFKNRRSNTIFVDECVFGPNAANPKVLIWISFLGESSSHQYDAHVCTVPFEMSVARASAEHVKSIKTDGCSRILYDKTAPKTDVCFQLV